MTAPSSQAYRSDIDGLRAIAVLLVIVFHLAPTLFPNGFVGVDLFFVISGFVVTRSVMNHDNDSLAQGALAFWRRRITRIYPALLVCVLLTLAAFLLVMPPFPLDSYNRIIRTAVFSLVGASNLYLYREHTDYFVSDQYFNPFIHTWSLGVEEQFYLLFSVIFLIVPLGARRLIAGSTAALQTRIRLGLLVLLTVISAIFLAFASRRDPIAAYYLLQFRFCELGVGSLLAYLAAPGPALQRPRRSRMAPEGVRLLALALLVWLILAPGGANPTGAIALAALAGAALVGIPPLAGAPATGLLTWRPVRQIGLLSYSLYLWHWPVFVLFDLTVGLRTPVQIAGALLLVLALASASYYAVEQPLRRPATSFRRRTVPVLGAVGLVTVALVAAVQLHPGLIFAGGRQAWARDWLPDRNFAYAGPQGIRQRDCDLGAGADVPIRPPSVCSARFSMPRPHAPTVLVVGDSLAFADWGMLSRGFDRGAFQWTALPHDGCNINDASADRPASCKRYWQTMPQRIQQSLGPGDALLIAAIWKTDESGSYRTALAHLDAAIQAANAVGARVIVQAPLPQFDRPAFLCTREWYRLNYRGCVADRRAVESDKASVTAAVAARSRGPGKIVVWDPIDALCDASKCMNTSHGLPVFRDTDHLSYRGSLDLGDAFAKFFKTASGAG